MDRDDRIYHPWKEEAYQRGIFSTSTRHESNNTKEDLAKNGHTFNAYEDDNDNHGTNGTQENIAGNDYTSNAHENNSNGPWSPTLPSSYPTPLHAYGQYSWEKELEVEVGSNGNEGGGEDPSDPPLVGPQLRSRVLAIVRLLLLPLEEPTQQPNRGGKRKNAYQRAQWSDRALELAMEVFDNDHFYSRIFAKYKILRSSIRDHMNGKTRSRKMDPKGVLTVEDETALCNYIEEMTNYGLLLIPIQIKIKVGQMIEERINSFKNGILGHAWMRWFMHRHPQLTLTAPQGLE